MTMVNMSPATSSPGIAAEAPTNGNGHSELVSGSVETIGEEKARKVLDRVDFLSKLREEVVTQPELKEKLENLAEMALDLPEWWIPGKHDYDLVVGAARHGLARMEYYILNDMELSFKDILKRCLEGKPLTNQKGLEEWEAKREERQKNKADTNGESKNGESKDDKGKKKEKKRTESGKSIEGETSDLDDHENGEVEPMETDETPKKSDKDKDKEKEKLLVDKAKALERSSIPAPQLNLQQMEAAIAKGGGLGYDQDMINDLMVQTYAASVRWPKDLVLQERLKHIVSCLESESWPVPANYCISDHVTLTDPATPEPAQNTRDTSTPLSEMSELSQYNDDGNVLTHGGLANRKKRGRNPLDYQDNKNKFRASSLVSSAKASTDDSMSEASGTRGGLEITPVNDEGVMDLKKGDKNAAESSSFLDKLGFQKRKLTDAPTDDKSKKKKRLDDLLSGLHAGKGNNVPEKKESAMDSLLRKATEGMTGMTDLNKLQEMLGPLGGNPADAKVQKWLADQMGVTPDRPITPGSSSTATSKRPASTSSASGGGWTEWMSKLSGEEHVTVFNRNTLKRLSGSDGPKLKNLAQWLIENDQYEVDPKWAEEMGAKYSQPEGKRKGPGRPPLDDTPSRSGKTASPGVGPSYNSMASLGLDPKNPMAALAALDPKNPNSLAALYGLDPKKMDPMTAAMLGLGDPKNPMKMDPMMMAALSMDSKTLQAMGIDPKKLGGLAQPASSKGGDKTKAAAATPTLDPMLLAAFGMDPKNPKLDPMVATALGLDPKNPKFDPVVLASMGLDPKNPNSTLLAAMAAMDPTGQQLAAMYGMMPPGYPGMPGMDMYGKGKHSPTSKDKNPAPSPRSSQRDGPSPRPPSRASVSSKDGKDGRSTPSRSSAGPTSSAQPSPRPTSTSASSSMAGMFGGMNPALFGLDPKILSSMDPKLLQAAGIDPKMMGGLDPKMLAMMDPRMMGGMDLKALSQMDPKLLQAAGIDPSMLSKMLDPKALAGMDPKMLASMGMDPKMLASMGMDPKMFDPKSSMPGAMDPKLLASMGLDPKMLAAMDPNVLKSMGIDPKMLGLDTKTSQASAALAASSSSASSMNDAILKSMGIDPKMLAGMDPKLLGFDPKILSDPKMLATLDPKLLLGGMDPKALGLDPKMFGMSGSSSSGKSLTTPTSATSTTMSIPASSGGLDPRLLGLDPKMLMGLDEKALKSLGLDPNIVKSLIALENKSSKSSSSSHQSKLSSSSTSTNSKANTSTTFAGLDPKMFPGVDPKLLQSLDPKMLSMMDPKTMAALMDPKMMAQMYDPKMLAGMDPKVLQAYGMDPKMLQAYGIDPKQMDPKTFTGIDPKMLGLDPKMLQGMDPKLLQSMGIDLKALGMDPKSAAASSQPSTSAAGGMMDPKLLQMAGIDPKMLAGMDPKVLASYGIDPKMLAQLDPKSSSASSSKSSSLPGGLDPKLLAAAGIDPKMLEGMDPKVLASMGLDTKSLTAALDHKNAPKSMASALDPKMLGMDAKMLASMGLDPKMLASMDPKMLASLGIDPKMLDPQMLGGMDPKLMASMGMDPKMLASMGMDPKMLASMGMDPKMLASMGMDPKMMAAMMDPKMMAAMMDPKAMASMDPKMLASMGLDPKMLASMGMDPKMLSDPNLMAMYSMGMPGLLPPSGSPATSISNGVASAGTPLPSNKGGTTKPKPGTVAAALQEKKESEKARAETTTENHEVTNHDRSMEEGDEDFRKGLTSEERVLLREKKKERLMKEVENDSDEGLNLSVSKNGGSEHTTKLEALLAKPIEDMPQMPHPSEKGLNGESTRTEGV